LPPTPYRSSFSANGPPAISLFVLFLTVFIDLVGFGIIISVLPLYAEHFHASPMAIGCLTGIYSGMQIVFTPILGKLPTGSAAAPS
jgi:predicted MFS family arabinose efflux permease